MNHLFDLMFSGFWAFIGGFCILSLFTSITFVIWNRFWRHWNIRKHGYPPSHCDADGDFKPQK